MHLPRTVPIGTVSFRVPCPMEILRTGLADVQAASGVAVVIDVIRAFTVAAYALAGGAEQLWLVRTTEEALALRTAHPDSLLAGEIRGRLIAGFDLNNSPSRMARADVRGRIIVQRTGAGTQGAVGAAHAPVLYVCSLVTARATAARARSIALQRNLPVTLVSTGQGSGEGIEDDACADYLEALLRQEPTAGEVLRTSLERIRMCGRLDPFTSDDPDFPAEDVPAFMAVDRFGFAMRGTARETAGVRYVAVVSEGPIP